MGYFKEKILKTPFHCELYNNYRDLLLIILKRDRYKVGKLYGLNQLAVENFLKYTPDDYLKIRGGHVFRYLTVENIITVLQANGYQVDISITLPD